MLPQQVFQLRARGVFPPVGLVLRDPIPAGKFEIFAEGADVFFQHGLGAAFAALLGRPRVVVGAVEADAQIRPAFQAAFAASRLAA